MDSIFAKCELQMNTRAVEEFVVTNSTKNLLKIIPYIGCKAGFSDIFDRIIPSSIEGPIYDVFGGSGAFAFYASHRFGSHRVTYNDNNPVVVNLIKHVQTDPTTLWNLYHEHYRKSSTDYYYSVRERDLEDGIVGAADFLYLAKNAFSGKIRFNSRNKFNAPIRKGSTCPRVNFDGLMDLSRVIANLTITNRDYKEFATVRSSLLYLDPPYFNNTNGHYNGVLNLQEFKQFLRCVEDDNQVVLSEQNPPEVFDLPDSYTVYPILLRRSLQYFTQRQSNEIIAVNF